MDYLKILLIIVVSILSMPKMNSQNNFEWNYKKKIEQKNNREDSTKWDRKNLKLDLFSFQEGDNFGFFPTPNYDLIGKDSFDGMGFGGSSDGLVINNCTFVYKYFYVRKCLTNNDYIDDKNDEVFFTIIVMTDFIDTVNYSHIKTSIISRNHPDYLAKGCIKTQANEIDYTAFITGDRREYAIINERIFDLGIGRVILIIPSNKISGMLLSRQIDIPISSHEDMKKIVPEILKNKKIVDFYIDDH